MALGPIGVFDSGYGGLTILDGIRSVLPSYSYLYLGDNARAPYGQRSFEVVYEYTRQCVKRLFDLGCPLVILACNTASAKALRSIQQNDLPRWDTQNRVLGIIRPTAECLGNLSENGHIGLFATRGTVSSKSYDIEVAKFFPKVRLTSVACPMWVSLVENGEAESDGADFFVRKYVAQIFSADPLIDTLLLGCTHFPLLYDKILGTVPPGVRVVKQGAIVASSLADYLRRHPEMDARLQRDASCSYLTTESPATFESAAGIFLKHPVSARHADI